MSSPVYSSAGLLYLQLALALAEPGRLTTSCIYINIKISCELCPIIKGIKCIHIHLITPIR